MKAIYTVCSISHLFKAKALADSIANTNAGTHLYICICERLDQQAINQLASLFAPAYILTINDLEASLLAGLNPVYNTFEISCALKPFFGYHLVKGKQYKRLVYLDSDIKLFQALDNIWQELDQFDFIITPHFTKPVPYQHAYKEQGILKHGIYNSGFFAFNQTDNAMTIIFWWLEKLKKLCIADANNGLSYDQIWFNLVPVYFPKVKIAYDLGYNVAYWNLPERTISYLHNSYTVNNATPLKFFHFSGFDEEEANTISRHLPGERLQDHIGLIELFNTYRIELKTNKALLQPWMSNKIAPGKQRKFLNLFRRK